MPSITEMLSRLESTPTIPHLYCKIHDEHLIIVYMNHSIIHSLVEMAVGTIQSRALSRINAVQQYLTHTSKVNGITVPMHCNVAAIHHYFIRSRQEFQSKYKWEEDSNWNVHKRYQHVLENIDYYRSVPDDRLKEHVLQTIPNYAMVLEEYKSALLNNDYCTTNK